ncbi:hypothetical protein KRX57_02080 [Weeksellaceae bacterium TAE3-ERU29]|nr:hypothetical protein [Weeksellaceae bacterium TAE3-ERU29]
MDNKLEQLKKDLVQEIKDLAQSIATSESYIGLLSNEIKFRSLQEKFIVLKFLEQRKLSLDVFDLPILTQDEKREVLEHEGFFEDEQPVIFDFDVKQEEEYIEEETVEEKEDITEELLDEEIERVLEEAEKLEEVNKYLTPSSEDIPEEKEVEEEQQELKQENTEEEFDKNEINEGLFDSISYDDTVPPENKIKEISLDFNDRIGFLNQLFLGDEESMNLVINTLNRISDVRSSNMYLDDLKREMNWNEDQEEYFERLKELVLKRFD